MRNHQAPKVNDRVQFVGVNPRPHETVGIVNEVRMEYVGVLWGGDRQGFLHRSQVEVY